jgi:hypothetical protein
MSKPLYVRLRQQLGPRCGYCRTSSAITGERHTIEHIIPTARGGLSEEDNLWISCRRCNRAKGVQVDAIDPETGRRVPLFNPRSQSWKEHFAWSGDGVLVVGLTSIGRATVAALQMNHPDMVSARRFWSSVGWHPPEE